MLLYVKEINKDKRWNINKVRASESNTRHIYRPSRETIENELH